MRKLLTSGIVTVLMAASCQAKLLRASNEVDHRVGELRQSVQRGEITERDLLLEVEALARKHRVLAEASPDAKTYFPTSDTERCLSALIILEKIGDKHSLPLFVEMAGSSDWIIRFNGIANYIKVAGIIGSLPFIENVPTDPDYPNANRLRVYLELEQEIDKTPLSSEDTKKMCAFLLERIQKEEACAQNADAIICNHLPDYANSIQRMAVR